MVLQRASESTISTRSFKKYRPNASNSGFLKDFPGVKSFISETYGNSGHEPIKEQLQSNGISETIHQIENQDRVQSVKERLSKHFDPQDPDFDIYSTYFTDASNVLYEEEVVNDAAPKAYLVEPYARRGTAKSRFDIPPCGGGVQGKIKYLAEPGSKAHVQWIIQDPAPGGH